MCNCTDGQAHGIDKPRCGECTRRAQAGPHYDPKRGTGRTTQAVKTALIAALSGHRVMYVTGTQQQAQDLLRYAVELLAESKANLRTPTTATRITLLNGGWLEFRSMSGDLEFRGYREQHRPTQQIWDHWATEKQEAAVRRKARAHAMVQIAELMKAHGITLAEQLNRCHSRDSTLNIT